MARRSVPDSVFRVDPERVDSFLTHSSLVTPHSSLVTRHDPPHADSRYNRNEPAPGQSVFTFQKAEGEEGGDFELVDNKPVKRASQGGRGRGQNQQQRRGPPAQPCPP